MFKNKKAYRILVIEDNPGDFAIVEDFLAEQFIFPVVIHADNFKEAKAIMSANNNFNIILLDITLPDKSGPGLVDEMLQLATCPIIILTGYTDIDFSIKSISKGILDYLLKDDLNAAMLYKSIIYSIERRKAIAELEESEKRYSDLFHLSPQPMWVVDVETSCFLDVNEAAIRSYGYSREEFMSITTAVLTINNETYKKELNDLSKAPLEHFLFRKLATHQKKDGAIIHVSIESNLINFKNKKADLILVRDITQRIQYIGAIEKQNKKLQEIAWTQSHIVRAPLARMMAIIDLINELDIASPDCSELLGHIKNSATELDDIIREITTKTESVNINVN